MQLSDHRKIRPTSGATVVHSLPSPKELKQKAQKDQGATVRKVSQECEVLLYF
jgi:hypothetical protein